MSNGDIRIATSAEDAPLDPVEIMAIGFAARILGATYVRQYRHYGPAATEIVTPAPAVRS